MHQTREDERKCDVEFTDFGKRLRPDLQMSFCFKDRGLHIWSYEEPGFSSQILYRRHAPKCLARNTSSDGYEKSGNMISSLFS